MPPIVVPIAPQYADGFNRCLDAVARERKFLIFEEAPPLESTRRFVAENLAKGNPQFVALDGDTVVGWCDIMRLQRPAISHTGVLGIGIAAGYRGQGLGKRLMAAVMDAARAADFVRVELTVLATNLNAIGLYESLGFQREGLAKSEVRLQGVFLDSWHMAWFPQC